MEILQEQLLKPKKRIYGENSHSPEQGFKHKILIPIPFITFERIAQK